MRQKKNRPGATNAGTDHQTHNYPAGSLTDPAILVPYRWTRAIGRAPCGICGRDYDDGHRGDARDHRYRNALAGPGVSAHTVTAVAAVMAARATAECTFHITDEEVSDRLDLAEKTVRRVRDRMIESGYLIRTFKGGGRSGRASEYLLTLPMAAKHRTPETGESSTEHRTPEPGESETLDMRDLNTGHLGAKHWTPETPQEGLQEELQEKYSVGEAGASTLGADIPDEPETRTDDEALVHLHVAADLVDTEVIDAEIVDDPRPVPATGTGAPTAQTLIGQWIKHRQNQTGARPTPQTIGHLSRLLKELLDAGQPYEHVSNGLVLWDSKNLHPSCLPSCVDEARAPAPKPRRQQQTEDIFAAAEARWASGEPNPFMTDEERAIARGERSRFAPQQQSYAAEHRRQQRQIEIDGCDRCDSDGYRGGLPCSHDPDQDARARAYAADIRSKLRAKKPATTDTPTTQERDSA